MRNEAMDRVGALVGTWRVAMRDAWFLDPADRDDAGTATIEWLGDSFVLFRWIVRGETNSEMVIVMGHNDARDTYTALYHDERGTARTFAMTFNNTQWTLDRADPDMSQRFTAEVTANRIEGTWQASDDNGQTWRTDYRLILERS